MAASAPGSALSGKRDDDKIKNKPHLIRLPMFGIGGDAVRVPEEPLQWVFAIVLFSQGALKLWALRGK